MLIPIRCMTCGKVIADKWEYYRAQVLKKEQDPKGAAKPNKHFDGVMTKDVLDELGLDRYCCRRMMLGHVDLFDDLVP